MKTTMAGLIVLTGLAGASGCQAATLAGELVGTWTVTEAATHEANGNTTYPYGKSPKGILLFTADGHFVQMLTTGDVPKFASNNRTTGTPAEYQAVVQKTNAFFGTYSVDEAKKEITYKIESSTFPNWEGTSQPRIIVELNAKQFVYKNPSASAGGVAENKWRREGK